MPARFMFILGAVIVAIALGAVPRGVRTTYAAPYTWSAAADMPYERESHTLTLLPNGKVLMAGGTASAGPRSETAIYTRSSNTWAAAAPMMYDRALHRATLLRDGRILVTGGWNNSPGGLATEIYTPSTGTWSAAAPMSQARSYHTATLLLDGRVLVTGGDPGTPPIGIGSATSELYDPTGDTWTPVPDMSVNRGPNHSAVLLKDGRVLVIGEANPEIFDPMTNSWVLTSEPSSLVAAFDATLLPDGRVLAIADGGEEAWLYDPVADAWTDIADPPFVGFSPTLTLLGNGLVLRVGSTRPSAGVSTINHLFDPANLTWTETGSVSVPRLDHRSVLLTTGEVLVAGGTFGASSPSAELYDPTAWLPAGSPAIQRSGHTATLLWNGKTLVAGGGTAAAEAYDEANNTWSPAGTMSAPRENHAAARLNDGRVLVVGGTNGPSNGTNNLLTAEVYSHVTNSWTAVASPSLAHVGDSAVTLPDGRVLVYGGASDTRPEIYSPMTNTWALGADNTTASLAGPAYRTSTGRVLTLDFAGKHVYNPLTDTWSDPISYPGPFLPGNGDSLDGSTKIVIAGGSIGCPFGQTRQTNAGVIFDGATESFTTASSMQSSRTAHTGTGLYGGKLLAVGGYYSTASACWSTPIATVIDAELYDAGTNTWRSAGYTLAPRYAHTATRLTTGNVLLIGGRDDFGIVPTAERYDLGVNTDTDGDGYNDGLELALGQHPWSNCKTMRADINGDGIVNVGDIGKIAQNFGVRPPQARLDQNNDRVINIGDRGLASTQFGKSVLTCA